MWHVVARSPDRATRPDRRSPGTRATRVDAGRVVFVIRSERFPQVARGELIPEFKAYFNGLKWRRDDGWRPLG